MRGTKSAFPAALVVPLRRVENAQIERGRIGLFVAAIDTTGTRAGSKLGEPLCFDHFEGSHHLVVFMFEKMTVPDISTGVPFEGYEDASYVS